MVVVAAAGNEHGSVARPANCSGVVAVAALNRDGFKATYSNFGAQITLATVGGDYRGDGAWGSLLGDDGLLILDNGGTTSPGSPTYSRVFGSSFSAPIVAGAVSLMLSANPNLSVTQIVSGLRISARPHVTSPKIGACSAQNPGRCICSTATCGAGILDATQAVLYALNPSSYVAPAQSPAVIDNADVDAAVALGNDLPPKRPVVEPTWLTAGERIGRLRLTAVDRSTVTHQRGRTLDGVVLIYGNVRRQPSQLTIPSPAMNKKARAVPSILALP